MADNSSEDWLPTGWTVEVKVRKNGKKDKFYIAPSGEPKFNSKIEASRYLVAEQLKLAKSKKKKKGSRKLFAKKDVVEKVSAEGLPSGWTKEIKIRKTGSITKRDPYYTDPVSGYVFRSLKDVHRYLNTGELGKLAFKPSSDVGLEDAKVFSPAEAEIQNLAGSRIDKEVVVDQSLKSNGINKDVQILKSDLVGESILSLYTSDENKGLEDITPSSINMLEDDDSKKIEGKTNFSEYNSDLAPEISALPEKRPPVDRVVTRSKSKEKKEPNLPRRSSKRLAGVELDPTPELKTNNRARRNKTRLSGETETSTAELFSPGTCAHHPSEQLDQLQAESEVNCTLSTSKSTESMLESKYCINLPGDLVSPEEKHPGEAETNNKLAENQALTPVFPVENQASTGEQAQAVETENKNDAKPGSSVIPIETNNKLAENRACTPVFPVENQATPGEQAQGVETENKNDAKPGSPVIPVETNNKLAENRACTPVFPVENQATPGVQAQAVETEKKNDAKPGSSVIPVETNNKLAENRACTPVFLVENQATPGEQAQAVETENKNDAKPGSPVFPVETNNKLAENQACTLVFPVENQATPGEQAQAVETENKNDAKPGSSLDLPFGDSWPDPCIEFAVKTLTGAIPVGDDLDIQDYFDFQMKSSEGDSSMLPLPSFDLGNSLQTDLWSQQFDYAEKPALRQQTSVAPTLPHTGNGSLQNSRQQTSVVPTLPHTGHESLQNSGEIGAHKFDEEKR